METSHRWSGTVCDDLRCSWKLKIAGKWSILSQRVAGPKRSLIPIQTNTLDGIKVIRDNIVDLFRFR